MLMNDERVTITERLGISWNSAEASRQCCLCSLSSTPLPGVKLMVRPSDLYSEGLGFKSQVDLRFFSMDLFLTLSTKHHLYTSLFVKMEISLEIQSKCEFL